jgi:ribulose-phosphate 3-epimerase
MDKEVLIAPSILSADFSRLGEQVALVAQGGADLIHVDVMDGHFVPQLSFGPEVVAAVRAATNLPIEVHLMVSDPADHLAVFAGAGAERLIFHAEAHGEPQTLIAAITGLGCEAGIALSPETPAEAAFPYLEDLAGVTVMLVHPGRGGQQMLDEHLSKVPLIRHEANERGNNTLDIEVDGGVKSLNARRCVEAGATRLVAGSAVYRPGVTPQQALAELLAAIA